jgi:hypothetical protein
MSKIRVEIGKRFATLDDFFSRRLHEVWGRLADTLRKPLGELLDGYDGRLALEHLIELLDNASEPCPALTGALSDVLSIRLEYRTQLYPRVRSELGNLLNLEVINPRPENRKNRLRSRSTNRARNVCTGSSAAALGRRLTTSRNRSCRKRSPRAR